MKKSLVIILSMALLASFVLMTGCTQEANEPESTPVSDEAEEISFEGKTLNLYVAAGMKTAMDQVIETFKDETGAQVSVNYGPSGGLYAQIQQDQPCDLYYSADWLYIEKIEEDGKLEKGDKFLTDNIVLVVSETGKDKVEKMEDLGKEDVVFVIADAQAPAGVYSKNSLVNLGLWDDVSANIKAMPSTVNQVAIMVVEDQVDAGLLFNSGANGNGLEAIEVVDEEYSEEIIFSTAIIKDSQIELAEAFAEHAMENIAVFEECGWKAYE